MSDHVEQMKRSKPKWLV